MSEARRAALDVVSRVRERSAYAHEVLNARLRASDLAPADAALATRLAYGTLSTVGTLDEALGRYATGKLEPRVRDALRIAAYELLFMLTPPRAAVHQGVELVRSVRPQAAGLANAVLRRLAEDADAFPWGDPKRDVEALARLHGHPLWLARLWVDELGFETAAAIMAADNEPASLYVALNPFAGDPEVTRRSLAEDGADPIACPLSGCFELRDASAGVRSRAVADGGALVVDASAQFVASLAHVCPGATVLEVGSGRGTKTILLQAQATSAGGAAHIYAVDLHQFKADLLGQRMERLAVPGVTALAGDARDLAGIPRMPAAGSVDVALVDAPCSGLGTLRRHPEKRWRLGPSELDTLAELGLELLTQAASLVRPGGVVVYSTCTIDRRENQEVVEAFLGGEGGRGFRIDPLGGDVPDPWRRFVTPEGYFSSYPVPGGPDGHFAARLARSDRT